MCAGKDELQLQMVCYRAGDCHSRADRGMAHMLGQFCRSMEGVRVAGWWLFANTGTTHHPTVGNGKDVCGCGGISPVK